MSESLAAYVPQDRVRSLACDAPLPERTQGSVLFVDISGFTLLTERLSQTLGRRRGAEEITRYLDEIYTGLIGLVDVHGGSVVSFAGDAIVCWFDRSAETADSRTAHRAVSCGLAMHHAMRRYGAIHLRNGPAVAFGLKVAVASGPVRRLLVGDPDIQLFDTLAGTTVSRVAAAEEAACRGETLVDKTTWEMLDPEQKPQGERKNPSTGECFIVVRPGSLLPATGGEFNASRTTISPETLRPFLQQDVFERVRSGQNLFLTELRPAVALFLRFTHIDYEVAEAPKLLDSLVRHAQYVVTGREGTLLQVTLGDKGSYLYAAFGAPVAHEDDTRRALQAALALRELVPSVQIGVSRGIVRTGAYGSRTRRTYGVQGSHVHVAVRLMQEAQPGETLVSEAIRSSSERTFHFAARPPLQMKGAEEVLPVFALAETRQFPALQLHEPEYPLPMVGRERELQSLLSALDAAQHHQEGKLIAISADAGLGKSRLIAEVIRYAREKGFKGCGAACQPDGLNTPYVVWRSVWHSLFDFEYASNQDESARHLERTLEIHAPHRVSALPLLGAVLGVDLPENEFTRHLRPQHRESVLKATLVTCFQSVGKRAAGRHKGILIVFEDVHWMDELSHDLMGEIAAVVAGLPVLIVVSYRVLELRRRRGPRISELPNSTEIVLRDLNPSQAEQAIRSKYAQLFPANDPSLPKALLDRLSAQAHGNPFFLEELMHLLRDRGMNPHDPAVSDQIELPDSLHALVLSRVDQLSSREQNVLRVASVVGRQFHVESLCRCHPELGPREKVTRDLQSICLMDLIAPEESEARGSYIFKHVALQEAIYASLPHTTRSALHEQLALFLESTTTDSASIDLLAFHFGRSENTAKQIEYFRKAGEAAQFAYSNESALGYFESLVSLLHDPGEKAEVHLRRGAVLELTGSWENAESEYRIAMRLAEEATDARLTARSQLVLGVLCQESGRYEEALEWLTLARHGYDSLRDRTGYFEATVERGIVFWRRGDFYQARHELESGIQWARTAGDAGKPCLALALHILGNVAWNQGDGDAAQTLREESHALRRELGDRSGVSASLNSLGNLADYRGDYESAKHYHQQSLELSREIGNKIGIATSLNNLGNLALRQGDTSTARTLLEEGLALKRQMGTRTGIVISEFGLGMIAMTEGKFDEAWRRHRESLLLAIEIDNKPYVAANLVGLAGVIAGDETSDPAEVASIETALRLIASAEALMRRIDGAMDAYERDLSKSIADRARSILDDSTFGRAWTQGATTEPRSAYEEVADFNRPNASRFGLES